MTSEYHTHHANMVQLLFCLGQGELLSQAVAQGNNFVSFPSYVILFVNNISIVAYLSLPASVHAIWQGGTLRTLLVWNLIHWDAYRGCAGRQDQEDGRFGDGCGGSTDMPRGTFRQGGSSVERRRFMRAKCGGILHRWMMIIFGVIPAPLWIYYYYYRHLHVPSVMPSSVYLDSLDVAGQMALAKLPGVLWSQPIRACSCVCITECSWKLRRAKSAHPSVPLSLFSLSLSLNVSACFARLAGASARTQGLQAAAQGFSQHVG